MSEPKVLVFTGKFKWSLNDLKIWAKACGYVVHGSVSRRTDFVISNESLLYHNQVRKAFNMGIPILGEEVFKSMIADFV